MIAVALALAMSSPSPVFVVHRDLAYVADHNPSHTLDLYVPQRVARPPLLVFAYGGAWISGDKKGYGIVGEYFASRKMATAVVNYRLSSDAAIKHPAHCKDVAAAINWLQQRSSELGVDGGRTFILGHSAGAHIEGMFATDRSLLGKAKIAAFIGLEGIYDL